MTRVAALLALALLASGCGEQALSSKPLPKNEAPLIGITDRYSLVKLNPRTLKSRSRALKLPGFHWNSAWSPDRKQVAIGVSNRGRIQIVSIKPWRKVKLLQLDMPSGTPFISWPQPDRIVALGFSSAEETPGWVLDPTRRKPIRRFNLPAPVIDGVNTRHGIAAILSSFGAIVDARLALIDEDTVRTIALPGVSVGTDHGDGREVRPAIAADPLTGRVFVVDAQRLRVLEIDPATAELTEHDLTPGKSVFAWLEGTAYAKGGNGPSRFARVVGRGLLAISGATMRNHQAEPHDLVLVDTSSWKSRTVAPEVAWFSEAQDALIDWGSGKGVTVYGLDGTRRWSLDREVIRAEVVGDRVFLSVFEPNHATFVHDMETGRRLRRYPTAEMPIVIPGP